jgi:hypothetical protein
MPIMKMVPFAIFGWETEAVLYQFVKWRDE